VHLGGLSRQQKRRRVELRDDRRPFDARAGAQLRAVVDRRLALAALEGDTLAADEGVLGAAARRQLGGRGPEDFLALIQPGDYMALLAYLGPDPALAEVLLEGRTQGEAIVEDLAKNALKIVGGWSSAMHAFDYNLDSFEVGALDDPQWKIGDRTVAYVTRAAAARAGLWGNHGYEARYDLLWQDEHGDELSGANTYELTLAPPPSVDAFWSLTMYDEPHYYLVANPIDRYSIGDRTPGLVVGDDGAVTIRMSVDDPGDAGVNWLPSPPGAFRPVLRSYQPDGGTLHGTYQLPTVRRLS
jgi:hypothetical protein